MTNNNELECAVTKLANARADLGRLKGHIEKLEKEIVATSLGQDLAALQDLKKAKAGDIINLELDLRLASLDAFDGEDRHPHPAVTVKEYTVLKYDDRTALNHCRFNLPQAIKLNAREFEKVAKIVTFDFVAIGKEHRATIAGDLSEWVTPAAKANNE